MEETKVQEVYRDVIVTANLDDTLSSCMNQLIEHGLEAIPVTDERGEYAGMISMRRLRRSVLNPTAVRIRKIIERVPSIQIDDTIGEAARVMIENKSMHLPVYSGTQFRGVITHNDILRYLMKTPFGIKSVEFVMSKDPVTVDSSDSAAKVLNLFREYGFSHAPVVDGQDIVGIVSIRDIIDLVYREKKRPTVGERVGERITIADIPVKGVMISPVITVDVQDTLTACIEKMFKKDVSCLVVVDQHGLAGIVTKLDLVEPLAQEAAEARRITVQFSVKPSLQIDDKERQLIIRDFMSFKRKYAKALGKGTLFVYMKTQGSTSGRHTIVQCRLNLRTTAGHYYSSSEAWGTLDAFSIALDRLARGVLQDKQTKDGPRMSTRYTEGFLDTEM